jgi:uncharacterized protein (TIGR03643 family)
VRVLNAVEIDRIIEMAWEDRTPFEAIKEQFGLTNGEVIKLMRQQMKPSSFKLWRKRTQTQSSITKSMKRRDFVSGVFQAACHGKPRTK